MNHSPIKNPFPLPTTSVLDKKENK
uniref:Uncharacterized protein n=1 Tax=Anguilla anguilla TaxID=7936 RepID=A0A0E9RIE0_ANGAN